MRAFSDEDARALLAICDNDLGVALEFINEQYAPDESPSNHILDYPVGGRTDLDNAAVEALAQHAETLVQDELRPNLHGEY